jgi:hypothetical protein
LLAQCVVAVWVSKQSGAEVVVGKLAAQVGSFFEPRVLACDDHRGDQIRLRPAPFSHSVRTLTEKSGGKTRWGAAVNRRG